MEIQASRSSAPERAEPAQRCPRRGDAGGGFRVPPIRDGAANPIIKRIPSSVLHLRSQHCQKLRNNPEVLDALGQDGDGCEVLVD